MRKSVPLFCILLLIRASAGANECAVYFAPSTIPGAGNGMFAGRDFFEGEVVTPGDLIVAETDFSFHNGLGNRSNRSYLIDSYSWSPESFDGMVVEAHELSGVSFGIGAAVNSFLPLENMKFSLAKVDSAGIHRQSSPGAGAFTIYHDRQGVAWKAIPAGMELFISYGEDYFENRESFRGTPMLRHYAQAHRLLHKFVNKTHYWSDVLHIKQETIDDIFYTGQSFKDIWNSPVLSALPADPNKVQEIAMMGIEFVHLNRSIHTLDWLREHGTCTDNLQAKTSTIKDAGRGAFTRRSISEGEVIAPVPLIHVERGVFDMYESQQGTYPPKWDPKRNVSKPFHKQLLLNYCFGHKETDVLLCPYGVGTALVNHGSKNQTNAEIVWNDKLSAHPEWKDMHPEKWASIEHAGLAFNFVATRDLDEGEEVLIDYGDEWEIAWQEHVDNWNPPPYSYSYHPDYELNNSPDLIIPTVAEGSHNTKVQDLFCREIFRRWWGLDEYPADYFPCRATARYVSNFGEMLYNVEILLRWDDPSNVTCVEELDEVLFGVPRDIFLFIDRPYTRDQAQPWSFRHEMQIPDGILPDAWRNTKTPMPTDPYFHALRTAWNTTDVDIFQPDVWEGETIPAMEIRSAT